MYVINIKRNSHNIKGTKDNFCLKELAVWITLCISNTWVGDSYPTPTITEGRHYSEGSSFLH